MKIPEFINIGGHRIPVLFTNQLLDKYEGLTTFGEFCPETLVIRLAAQPADHIILETFFHEVIEAIVALHELPVSHSTIQTLGLVLHQALCSE